MASLVPPTESQRGMYEKRLLQCASNKHTKNVQDCGIEPELCESSSTMWAITAKDGISRPLGLQPNRLVL